MCSKFFFILLGVFSFLALPLTVQGQNTIANLSELSRIRNGTTYVAMKDPQSEKSVAYVKVFKENWTLTKIEFIKNSEIEKYFSTENSFITISYDRITKTMGAFNSRGDFEEGITYTITSIYLEFWACNEKYFEPKK